MSEPSLTDIGPDLFDRVWKIVSELTASERHFNQLQARYRTLASTWLLATFAGIGLLYSERLDPVVPKERTAMGRAVAGMVGITLLWAIDIFVYHRLLRANYDIARKLEDTYGWLPQVRRQFSASKGRTEVRVILSLYYLVSVVLLLNVAGFFAFRLSGMSAVVAGFALASVSVVVALAMYAATRRG